MDAPAFTYLGSGLATRLHTCTEIVNTLNTFLPVGNRLLRHLPNTKRSSDLLKNMSHDHAINICTHTHDHSISHKCTTSVTGGRTFQLEGGESSTHLPNTDSRSEAIEALPPLAHPDKNIISAQFP